MALKIPNTSKWVSEPIAIPHTLVAELHVMTYHVAEHSRKSRSSPTATTRTAAFKKRDQEFILILFLQREIFLIIKEIPNKQIYQA